MNYCKKCFFEPITTSEEEENEKHFLQSTSEESDDSMENASIPHFQIVDSKIEKKKIIGETRDMFSNPCAQEIDKFFDETDSSDFCASKAKKNVNVSNNLVTQTRLVEENVPEEFLKEDAELNLCHKQVSPKKRVQDTSIMYLTSSDGLSNKTRKRSRSASKQRRTSRKNKKQYVYQPRFSTNNIKRDKWITKNKDTKRNLIEFDNTLNKYIQFF